MARSGRCVASLAGFVWVGVPRSRLPNGITAQTTYRTVVRTVPTRVPALFLLPIGRERPRSSVRRQNEREKAVTNRLMYTPKFMFSRAAGVPYPGTRDEMHVEEFSITYFLRPHLWLKPSVLYEARNTSSISSCVSNRGASTW